MGIVATALAASTVAADDPPVPSAARAQALFEQGIADGDRGDWSSAAARFRASLELAPSDRTAFNLARALTALGELDAAGALLRGILEDPGADLLIRDAARMLFDEIAPRLTASSPHTASSRDTALSPREAARSSMGSTSAAAGQEARLDHGEGTSPVTQQWWFWTGAGALAVTAVVVGVLLAAGGPEPAQGDVRPIYVGDGS